MASIWLVRHAPVTVSGLCYGRLDVPTTCSAEEAAARIEHAANGAERDWKEIWSSPAQRTRSVGEALSSRLGIPRFEDMRLSELDFGEWEGRSYSDLEIQTPERFERWMRLYESEGPPGGESVADLRLRFQSWFNERSATNRTIVAVTHAGIIRVARALRDGTTFGEESVRAVEHLRPEAHEASK
jgi:alpha-ribazole phosphatase